MSEMPKFVTKKRVTVICKNPFRIGLIPYSTAIGTAMDASIETT